MWRKTAFIFLNTVHISSGKSSIGKMPKNQRRALSLQILLHYVCICSGSLVLVPQVKKSLHVFHVFRYLRTPGLTRGKKKLRILASSLTTITDLFLACNRAVIWGIAIVILPNLSDIVDIKSSFFKEGSTFNFKDKGNLVIYSGRPFLYLNK